MQKELFSKELLSHAGRTTLFCAIAELSVNDLYYGLAKESQTKKHAIKRHYNLCMDEAKRLKKVVSEIPEKVGEKAMELDGKTYSDIVIDSVYSDVAFYYEIIRLLEDRCGSNEQKRTMARAAIFNMKSELNIL